MITLLLALPIVLILFGLADFIAWSIAAYRAVMDKRLEEWTQQPNRLRLGAGFRLFWRFKR